MTGSIVSYDFGFENPDTGEASVTIAAGGTVTFSYPDGLNFHNVKFTDAQPTSCTQTAGTVIGPVPPLPAIPLSQGWTGTCRFDSTGTFPFACEAHALEIGEVVVVPPQTEPPDEPEEDPTPGPSGTGPAAPGPSGTLDPLNLLAGPAAGGLALARTQSGAAVRVKVRVSRPRSRLVVDVLARRSVLGLHGPKQVRIGRYAKTVPAGRRTVTVALNRAARRALARRDSLPVTVKIAVRPESGSPFTATRTATVKP